MVSIHKPMISESCCQSASGGINTQPIYTDLELTDFRHVQEGDTYLGTLHPPDHKGVQGTGRLTIWGHALARVQAGEPAKGGQVIACGIMAATLSNFST